MRKEEKRPDQDSETLSREGTIGVRKVKRERAALFGYFITKW